MREVNERSRTSRADTVIEIDAIDTFMTAQWNTHAHTHAHMHELATRSVLQTTYDEGYV